MKLYPDTLLQKIGFEHISNYLKSQTHTDMARRRIAGLLFSSSRQHITTLLTQTGELLELLKSGAGFPLRRIPDISDWLDRSKAKGSILPQQGILDVIKTAKIARRIKSFVRTHQHEFELKELPAISERIEGLKKLEDEADGIINEHGEIKSGASPKLRKIRNQLNNKKSRARKAVQKVMEQAVSKGIASDEGITIRAGRMVIPIQVEYKRRIDGFVHDVSSSGQTVFLEPVEALDLNNEIRQLEIEEQNEIERLMQYLTSRIRSYRTELQQNAEVLAELDVIAAKARLGQELDGQIPTPAEDDTIVLRHAFNPVLALNNKKLEDPEKIVPLNLELDREERCLMITGPNAGGKSVAMKTLALYSLMMQAGIPVPADQTTRLPIYSEIFLDIGDDQSIESDLSTFSSRLQWIKETYQNCGSKSLIMIDEAGSGTDPDEGGALYQALIEQLIERESRIIVTTHHGSLKIFADEHPKAVNGSMEFNADNLEPTYRFKKGIPGSSYAFEIAHRMKLPEKLIEKSREIVGTSKRKLEHLITDLESQTQEARSQKREYESLRSEAEKLKQNYEQKLDGVKKERKKLHQKALEEAEEIVENANSRLERVIQEISERGQSLEKKDIKKARKKVHNQKADIKKQKKKHERRQESKKTKGPKPEIGDMVRIEDSSSQGELVDINGNKAVVLVNGLRLKTDLKKVKKIDSGPQPTNSPKKQTRSYTTDYNPRGNLSPSLMIRGMRAKEAMQKVQRYLDDAIAAGMHEVQIVHGKGQGILKNQVHDYLKNRTEVKRFELAPLQRGGAGCTIVKLR